MDLLSLAGALAGSSSGSSSGMGGMDPMALLGGSGNPLSGLAGQIFGGVLSMITGSLVVMVIALIIIIGAMWAITGFKWLYMGRKAGLDRDWMPFVPFAKAIYRLKIVDEAWWKMFFLEGWWFYGSILRWIIMAISANNWGTFANIIFGIYVLACIAYNMYWRYKQYLAFGIEPHMAIGILIPFSGGRRRSMDYQIAFTNNFSYNGKGHSMSQAARNLVNVPKAGKQGGGHNAANSSEPSISGLSGMYAGQDIPLAANEELLIGRDNNLCNLILDQNADKISRKHCSITFDPLRNAYMVTDYSSNGTYIDGGNRFVANMGTQVQRGTIIALGNRENRFRLN